MKFHVLDPRQPEWVGCFIEGEDLADALATWSNPTDKTGTYNISEVRELGTFKVEYKMSLSQLP